MGLVGRPMPAGPRRLGDDLGNTWRGLPSYSQFYDYTTNTSSETCITVLLFVVSAVANRQST